MMTLNFFLYRIHIHNAFYYLDTKAKFPATLLHPPQISKTNVNFLLTRMFYRVKSSAPTLGTFPDTHIDVFPFCTSKSLSGFE